VVQFEFPQGSPSASDLWETVDVAQRKRTLKITNTDGGIMVRCGRCRRVFFSSSKEEDFAGERALDIQVQFDKHDCYEDASQAAARIVREATEGG
jgi:hypothetical protein